MRRKSREFDNVSLRIKDQNYVVSAVNLQTSNHLNGAPEIPKPRYSIHFIRQGTKLP